MIRFSPSNAIFEGLIYFSDAQSEGRLEYFASFDTYHNDLRFEFQEQVFVYSTLSRSFIQDTNSLRKQISRFFFQKVNDEISELVYVSFLFQIEESLFDLKTYYMEGYLKEQLKQIHLPKRSLN